MLLRQFPFPLRTRTPQGDGNPFRAIANKQGIASLRTRTPQGDGNLFVFGIRLDYLNALRTRTPQGDGNRTFRAWNVFACVDFKNQNPARGRKLSQEGLLLVPFPSFKNQNPARGRKLLTIAALTFSQKALRTRTPQGDGNLVRNGMI